MKRYILLACIVTIVLVIGGYTNIKSNIETTNNKSIISTESLISPLKIDFKKANIEEARDFGESLKNGSVIMVSRDDSTELEVYNIAVLDKFIKEFSNKKEGYARIIKGTIKDGKLLVNKLQELESDGKTIKSVQYDCYAHKDTFTPVKPLYFPKIGKSDTEKSLRYTLCPTTDTIDSEGALLISFYKNSIKN